MAEREFLSAAGRYTESPEVTRPTPEVASPRVPHPAGRDSGLRR